MNVLVTGATGFTGEYVVEQLLKEQLNVSCFVRKESDITILPLEKVDLRYGDLSDPKSLINALRGMDAMINIASLGFGHAEGIVFALKEANVARSVFISTTAIFTQLNASSKAVRLAAEQSIQTSGLDYTILRPTMIYGSDRDRNMCRLIQLLRKWPLIPILGSGNHLQQPVHVGDVACAVLQSLKAPQAIGEVYNIAGAEPLTYNQVIDTIASILQRHITKIHLPSAPFIWLLNMCETVQVKLPIKAEQILRLNENKDFDNTKAITDFGYAPRTFTEGIRREIELMMN